VLDAVAPRLVDVGVSRWLLPLELVDQVRLAAAEVFDLRRELLPAPRSQRTYLLRSSVRCDLYYIDLHTGNIPTERPGPNSPKNAVERSGTPAGHRSCGTTREAARIGRPIGPWLYSSYHDTRLQARPPRTRWRRWQPGRERPAMFGHSDGSGGCPSPRNLTCAERPCAVSRFLGPGEPRA